jgi:glycosyltransferase involved in cell wall biosynthesis
MDYGDLISVVIPAYNRARSIARSVRSVLRQSYPNLELIVVDDCSTDETCAVVESFDDPRLRLIRQPQNGGASAARHAGILAARGELIAFLDSDDVFLPEKLEDQMRFFCALPPDHVACFHIMLAYGAERTPRGYRFGPRRAACVPPPEARVESGDLSGAFLRGNILGLPTALLKKSAYLATGGFDTRLKNNNDWDFHIRLSRQGRIGYLDEPLTLVYNSFDGISKNPLASAFSTMVIFGKIRRLAPGDPAQVPTALTVSRHLMLKGKPRSARRFVARAISLDPTNPRHYVRYGLCLMPGAYRSLRRSLVARRRSA